MTPAQRADAPDGAPPVLGADPADEAGQYTVRSVARALRLLDIVAEAPEEGLSLSHLARSLGASKSATFALARTLTRHGLLRGIRPGPRYTLGTALIRLGDITRNQLPFGEICRPVLVELADVTKMTSRVALGERGLPVFIDRVDGPGSVRFHTPLGQPEMPHTSAAGKAMLATMTRSQVVALCEQTGLKARTAHTITDIDSLLANLEEVRRQGYALDDEEDAEGIFCAGAAFFKHDGSCAGAISVTGIKGDMPSWRMREIGRVVRGAADQISQLLGGAKFAGSDAALTRMP